MREDALSMKSANFCAAVKLSHLLPPVSFLSSVLSWKKTLWGERGKSRKSVSFTGLFESRKQVGVFNEDAREVTFFINFSFQESCVEDFGRESHFLSEEKWEKSQKGKEWITFLKFLIIRWKFNFSSLWRFLKQIKTNCFPRIRSFLKIRFL